MKASRIKLEIYTQWYSKQLTRENLATHSCYKLHVIQNFLKVVF